MLRLSVCYICTIAFVPIINMCQGVSSEGSIHEDEGLDDIAFVDALFANSSYDKRVRPGARTGKATTINIDFLINSLSSISEISMDYQINVFLRQRWQDKRLAFPRGSPFNRTLTLNFEHYNLLWVPDLFFTNEKTARFHDVSVPNRLIQLSPNGDILYSVRVSISLGCDMLLHNYPVDKQICGMSMESYGYTTNDVIFKWRDMAKPVQVREGLTLPEFNLTDVFVSDCTAEYATGTFTCLKAELELQRLYQYYVIQVFVPSILIVVLSWVSFWIDINAVPARISLGLLTVLTITTQASGISSKLPRVSYIKAIDVWMFTNMVFVFGALIEYAIVNVLARKPKIQADKIKAKEEQTKQLEGKEEGTNNGIHHDKVDVQLKDHTDPDYAPRPSYCRKVWRNKALLVDVVSRIMFPASFIVFNAFYWLYYVVQIEIP